VIRGYRIPSSPRSSQ